jgi:hypothetical protein
MLSFTNGDTIQQGIAKGNKLSTLFDSASKRKEIAKKVIPIDENTVY